MNSSVSKSSKVLFKVAGILSYITLAICLIFAIGILFEISLFVESFKMVYTSVYLDLTEAELEQMKFYFVINCFFSSIINFYAGRAYLGLAKTRSRVLNGKRTLIFIICLQLFFGMALPCIFSIIAAVLYFKEPKAENSPIKVAEDNGKGGAQTQSALSDEALDFCAFNIAELKKLLNSKKITQEEYDIALNELLSTNFYSQDEKKQ